MPSDVYAYFADHAKLLVLLKRKDISSFLVWVYLKTHYIGSAARDPLLYQYGVVYRDAVAGGPYRAASDGNAFLKLSDEHGLVCSHEQNSRFVIQENLASSQHMPCAKLRCMVRHDIISHDFTSKFAIKSRKNAVSHATLGIYSIYTNIIDPSLNNDQKHMAASS